jgi:hypothetical protein
VIWLLIPAAVFGVGYLILALLDSGALAGPLANWPDEDADTAEVSDGR